MEDKVTGTVWCDASSIALGVYLTINGQVVEDASWMRKADDCGNIDVAELDSVLKGLNLALKWNLKHVFVNTDAMTFYRWVKSVVTNSHRPKVNDMSKMVVKRRLGVIAQLIAHCLTLDISLVKSTKNHADSLTHVNKMWLSSTNTQCVSTGVVTATSNCNKRVTHAQTTSLGY